MNKITQFTLGGWLRNIRWAKNEATMIIEIRTTHLRVGTSGPIEYADMNNEWEYSSDGGKTWTKLGDIQ